MRQLFIAPLFLLFHLSYGQSQLTTSGSDCTYLLPWNCETCTFTWTGDCVNNLPQGTGVLSVLNDGTEIMRYEGGMTMGRFNGYGTYRDAMNQMEGEFNHGQFVGSNHFITTRNARLDTTKFNATDQWETRTTVTKQVGNLYFTFPGDGYAFDHRDALVAQCIQAIEDNCRLINEPGFTEFTRIRFVQTKDEMLLHANLYVNALADIQNSAIHFLAEDDSEKNTNLPIAHEMMHIVAMTAWGTPPSDNNWLNEGLATYAQNNCSGFTVAEMYRYLLDEELLAPIETLAHQFFELDDMISYHQSAYIVEYLIEKYGIAKFETFWQSGFSSLESIYGVNPQQLEEEVNQHVLATHPQPANMDEDILENGCR